MSEFLTPTTAKEFKSGKIYLMENYLGESFYWFHDSIADSFGNIELVGRLHYAKSKSSSSLKKELMEAFALHPIKNHLCECLLLGIHHPMLGEEYICKGTEPLILVDIPDKFRTVCREVEKEFPVRKETDEIRIKRIINFIKSKVALTQEDSAFIKRHYRKLETELEKRLFEHLFPLECDEVAAEPQPKIIKAKLGAEATVYMDISFEDDGRTISEQAEEFVKKNHHKWVVGNTDKKLNFISVEK